MYCLQWLIPVLLIPKHWLHPAFIIDQAFFMWFYVVGFFMERSNSSCPLIIHSMVSDSGLVIYARLYFSQPLVCCVGVIVIPAYFGLRVIQFSMEKCAHMFLKKGSGWHKIKMVEEIG